MASLSSCLNAAGADIDPVDRKRIEDAFKEFTSDGMGAQEAALKAVEEVVNLAIGERNKHADQANKKGAKVEHLPPYDLPDNAQEALGMAQEQLTDVEAAEERKMARYRAAKQASKEAHADRAQSVEIKPVEGVKVTTKKRRKVVVPKEFQADDMIDPTKLELDNLFAMGLSEEARDARNSQEMQDIFGTYDTFGQGLSWATQADDVLHQIRQVLHESDPLVTLIDAINAKNIGLDEVAVYWAPYEDMTTADGKSASVGRYRSGNHYTMVENEEGGYIDEFGDFVPPENQKLYEGPVREIMLNDAYGMMVANRQMSPETMMRVFLHELIHAGTVHAINLGGKPAKNMQFLYEQTVAHYSKQKGIPVDQLKRSIYGFSNVKEFIAEAFTNPAFQETLASIEIKGGNQHGLLETAWYKFVDMIGEMLGRPVSNTMLERVLRDGESLFIDRDFIARELTLRRTDDDAKKAIEQIEAENQEMEQVEFGIKLDKTLGQGAAVLTSAMSGNPVNQLKRGMNSLREGGLRGRELLLGMLTNDTILREYGHYFNNLRPFKAPDGTLQRTNPLKDYIESKLSEQAEAKKFERAAELMHNTWRKLEKKYGKPELQAKWDSFNELIQSATMFEVHPDSKWDSVDNEITRTNNRRKKSGEIAHKKLRSQFMALPNDLKKMYKDARNFYMATAEKMRTQAILSIADMYELDNPQLRKLMLRAKTKEQLMAIKSPVGNWDKVASMIAKINSNIVANGPYFPINRFGDFVVSYEATETFKGYSSKEKAYEAAQREAAREPGARRSPPVRTDKGWQFTITVPGFSAFESLAEAEAFKAEMAAAGLNPSDVTRKQEYHFPDYSVAGQVMALAERKMSGQGAERGKMVMREALIHMLPDTSISKRFLRRKNIAGGSLNHRRSFASYVQSAGWHLAGMKHRRAVDSAFAALKAAGKGKVNSNVTMEMSQVVNEMERRHNAPRPQAGRVGRGVAKFGFINFLMSGSYSLINATQPYTLTLPHLGGKYGTARAMREMSKAYGLVAREIGNAIMNAKGGLAAFDSVSGDFDLNVATEQVIAAVDARNPEAAKMLRTLADKGIIDATFSLEVSEAARSDQPGVIDRVVEAGRVIPFAVEIMNRSTTAIAAYELAKKSGKNHSQATALAREAVVQTQFDYTELNRPRYFTKNDVLRAMTMFKIHPLGVYSFMVHNTRKALGKNASVEERRAAAKTLGLMMFTHGSLAGAAGSILMEPIRLALAMVAKVFDLEEDDEWLGWVAEPEIAMRRMLVDVTGSKDVAEVITHGLPRAVGVDVSIRIGLQNMMIQWADGQHPIRDTVIDSIMGPLLGSANSFSRGVDHLANGGSLIRSTEYFAPKLVRDLLRTYRYNTVGMTDWNGNIIQGPEQFTAGELLARAIGFGTSTESETYMARQYIQGLKQKTMNARKALMNRYAQAETRAEQREVWEEVQQFNKDLPADMHRAYKLTRAQLVRSMRQRARSERKLEKGVRFDRKERLMRDRIDWSNP